MKKVRAVFDKDSRKFHRFVIDEGQGLVGAIYIPKSQDVPKEVTIILEVQKNDK